MILIETTPNLYGISLKGDYNDLKSLHESLSNYLEFYQKNEKLFPYSNYEYMLSLCYDIRHSWMGARDYDIQDNNAEEFGSYAECIYELTDQGKKEIAAVRKQHGKGNLYFSVPILYPIAFHYLITLEYIMEDWYRREWFPSMPVPYDDISVCADRAQIQLFVAALWKNLADLFGREEALHLYRFIHDADCFLLPSELYTDMLLHYQLSQFKHLTRKERKQFLLFAFYEQLDEDFEAEDAADFPECYKQYNKALLSLQKAKASQPLTLNAFFDQYDTRFQDKKIIDEDEFEAFLQSLWSVTPANEDLEW